MRFAIIGSAKAEATPGAKGVCANCKSDLIAKCGEVKVRHWAHKTNPDCDPWWENETEWHRAWKDHFPADWQEVSHQAQGGERHIADVKTEMEWVLEFQHSYLAPEERRAREAFYPKLVWVVDGTRRKRDKDQFLNALNLGSSICQKPQIWKVNSDECTLLREWAACRSPVFFDFGSIGESGHKALWCLLTIDPFAYIVAFPRAEFVGFHRPAGSSSGMDFAGVLNKIRELVLLKVSLRQVQARQHYAMQAQLGPLQLYLARGYRARRRF